MEKVSAIITTHNRIELLKKAVKSVLDQTYENIELIVVDDCSEDGTSSWMKEIASENIKYYFIPKNESHGGNYARNLGIRVAEGEYIAFLDDDDVWHPDKIEEQMKVMLSSPNTDLVYCGRTMIYDNNFKYSMVPSSDWKGDLSQKVFYSIFCTTSMILTKKSILEKVGCFDENLKYWQEYDLLIRICQVTNINFAEDVLVDILSVSSDNARLTNRLDGWGQAVAYIEDKYKSYIDSLPDQIKRKRYKMIYNDAANRCFAIRDMKKQRVYLKKAFLFDPHITGFFRYIFNIPYLREYKIRRFINGSKMKYLKK